MTKKLWIVKVVRKGYVLAETENEACDFYKSIEDWEPCEITAEHWGGRKLAGGDESNVFVYSGDNRDIRLPEAKAIDAAQQKMAATEREDAEPVAYMHNTEGRVDVIHVSVRDLWLKCGQSSGFYREKVPCKVEHYTIPLYTHPPKRSR